MSSEMVERVRHLRQTCAKEHRALLGRVRGVEAMVEASSSPAPGDLARQLRTLVEQLEHHMKEEERSDLYRWLPEQFPELQRPLMETRREHPGLVEELKRLRRACDHAKSVGFDDPIGIGIRKVVAALRQHEATESELLHRALDPTA